MASVVALFEKSKKYPLGKKIFSRVVAARAPYFKSISPLITEVRKGHVEIFVKNQKKVHNHIGTVNAIALCAAAELSAGVIMEASLPKTLRWIPRGMTVRYTAKADGDVTAIADIDTIPDDFSGDWIVPVKVKLNDGTVVMEADISMYLTPKKKAS